MWSLTLSKAMENLIRVNSWRFYWPRIPRCSPAATKKISPRRREEILCDSSRLRVFVVNRMPALPGGRTKILARAELSARPAQERGLARTASYFG